MTSTTPVALQHPIYHSSCRPIPPPRPSSPVDQSDDALSTDDDDSISLSMITPDDADTRLYQARNSPDYALLLLAEEAARRADASDMIWGLPPSRSDSKREAIRTEVNRSFARHFIPQHPSTTASTTPSHIPEHLSPNPVPAHGQSLHSASNVELRSSRPPPQSLSVPTVSVSQVLSHQPPPASTVSATQPSSGFTLIPYPNTASLSHSKSTSIPRRADQPNNQVQPHRSLLEIQLSQFLSAYTDGAATPSPSNHCTLPDLRANDTLPSHTPSTTTTTHHSSSVSRPTASGQRRRRPITRVRVIYEIESSSSDD